MYLITDTDTGRTHACYGEKNLAKRIYIITGQKDATVLPVAWAAQSQYGEEYDGPGYKIQKEVSNATLKAQPANGGIINAKNRAASI